MDIKIVVVDDLPDGCKYCHLLSAILPHCCQAVLENGKFKEIEDVRTIPNWCPLRTFDQAFEWIMNQPATKFVVDYYETVLGGAKE